MTELLLTLQRILGFTKGEDFSVQLREYEIYNQYVFICSYLLRRCFA